MRSTEPAGAAAADGGDGAAGEPAIAAVPPPPPPGALPASAHASPAGVEPDLRVLTTSAQQAHDLAGFELYVEPKTPTILRRFVATHRHFLGLFFGGLRAWLRDRPRTAPGGARVLFARLAAALGAPFVDKKLRDLPFPVQLRRRLEILGPTYIKLGQILSLREDILPKSVTNELKNLLDKLPAVPYDRFLELIAKDLGIDPRTAFAEVERRPVGSASIGQTHRATLLTGERVILKVIKPGIRETLRRDVVLLKMLGVMLQMVAGRFQPKRVIDEFCHYTLREVDLRIEADNAETFAANFRDQPDIVFPKIYRQLSGASVLTMEFFDGFKPNSQEAQALSQEERERIIDLGASAIIRMLYRDGFFHADLHPGNLIVLPGPKAGFIDLGMVGRFDEELKRTMLYYFYCMVTGDAENAARYLGALAETGGKSNPKGFQREVEEICRRWHRTANFEEFSLGQLIMESTARGGQFRMYFPVEMVLMVKAIVTFEGVGQLLLPGFDVAKVSQKHINRIFIQQFSPLRMAKESLRGAPELVDALVKMPMLVTQGLRALDKATKQHPENPFAGLRGTLLGGFCIVAGAILAAFHGPWPLYVALFLLGLFLALRKGS
ncbi:MAG TPA: AarF/UbiB family protein [Thermoanaerobaculia bacterium]|nr:AarF/UbiB family protein [Thermoanaerobaculia bacterium]